MPSGFALPLPRDSDSIPYRTTLADGNNRPFLFLLQVTILRLLLENGYIPWGLNTDSDTDRRVFSNHHYLDIFTDVDGLSNGDGEPLLLNSFYSLVGERPFSGGIIGGYSSWRR